MTYYAVSDLSKCAKYRTYYITRARENSRALAGGGCHRPESDTAQMKDLAHSLAKAGARNSGSQKNLPAHRVKRHRASDQVSLRRQSGNRWCISDCRYYPGYQDWEAHQKCLC